MAASRIGRRWSGAVIRGWGAAALSVPVLLFLVVFLGPSLLPPTVARGFYRFEGLVGVGLTIAAGVAVVCAAAVVLGALWHRLRNRRVVRYDRAASEVVSGARIPVVRIERLDLEGEILTIRFHRTRDDTPPPRPWVVDQITSRQWPTLLELYRAVGQEPPPDTAASIGSDDETRAGRPGGRSGA